MAIEFGFWLSWELPIPNLFDMPNAAVARAPEDTKELVTLCRTGRLYEIERWIAAGKPLDVPAAVRF